MNAADVVILCLVALASIRGWLRGLIGQAFGLGGGLLGLLAGLALGPRLAPKLIEGDGLGVAILALLIVVVLVGVGQTIGSLIGHRFGRLARGANLGLPDSLLGAAFGVAVTLLVAWLIGNLLVSGPSRRVAGEVRGSAILSFLDDSLPPPPHLLAYLGRFLDGSGFPQVFIGLPRRPGPPVDLPAGGAARAAARAADQSTLRIVSPACGGTRLGTGWLAAPSTVVTNAHVVAGGSSVEVQSDAGESHPGKVVLFDPRTDLAVVHVDGIHQPALRMAMRAQSRGTTGAALGYSGGGRLGVAPAAVQDRFSAVGRDIYGRDPVSRAVYELRAKVSEGDSGGPFVLRNGRVAGVVFAASTTSGSIGYALTAAEVADEVAEGRAATSEVSTGACAP